MEIGREEKVHEVSPKKVPYEGDEVKPGRERQSEPAPAKRESDPVPAKT